MNSPEDVVVAFGALAEMASVLRDALMENGFLREEAVDVTKEWLAKMLTQASEHKDE